MGHSEELAMENDQVSSIAEFCTAKKLLAISRTTNSIQKKNPRIYFIGICTILFSKKEISRNILKNCDLQAEGGGRRTSQWPCGGFVLEEI